MSMFSLTRRFDPVNTLLNLQDELEHVFVNPIPFDLGTSRRDAYPPLDVLDDKDGLVIQLEVPGVPAENLTIETSGQKLTISGKRESQVAAKEGWHRRERWSGEFSRSLELPSYVDTAKAEASYKHGMLSIRIPKKQELQPRQIEIVAAS